MIRPHILDEGMVACFGASQEVSSPATMPCPNQNKGILPFAPFLAMALAGTMPAEAENCPQIPIPKAMAHYSQAKSKSFNPLSSQSAERIAALVAQPVIPEIIGLRPILQDVVASSPNAPQLTPQANIPDSLPVETANISAASGEDSMPASQENLPTMPHLSPELRQTPQIWNTLFESEPHPSVTVEILQPNTLVSAQDSTIAANTAAGSDSSMVSQQAARPPADSPPLNLQPVSTENAPIVPSTDNLTDETIPSEPALADNAEIAADNAPAVQRSQAPVGASTPVDSSRTATQIISTDNIQPTLTTPAPAPTATPPQPMTEPVPAVADNTQLSAAYNAAQITRQTSEITAVDTSAQIDADEALPSHNTNQYSAQSYNRPPQSGIANQSSNTNAVRTEMSTGTENVSAQSTPTPAPPTQNSHLTTHFADTVNQISNTPGETKPVGRESSGHNSAFTPGENSGDTTANNTNDSTTLRPNEQGNLPASTQQTKELQFQPLPPQPPVANGTEKLEAPPPGIQVAQFVHTEAPPARSAELIQQIVESARVDIAAGKKEITLRLDPPELGHIRINVVSERGLINAHLEVSSSVVREWMESNLGNLRTALEKTELGIGQCTVSLSTNSQGSETNSDGFQSPVELSRNNRAIHSTAEPELPPTVALPNNPNSTDTALDYFA